MTMEEKIRNLHAKEISANQLHVYQKGDFPFFK